MTRFRGCIDIHSGAVKQIVGGTLSDSSPSSLKTNFTSALPASHFSELYRAHDVRGCHVIKLGPGCDDAARDALSAWPGALQVGGGINDGNAREWIEAGAEKVIVTSYLFPSARFSLEHLEKVLSAAGGPEKLVIDLSCRRTPDGEYVVAMNRWQTLTDLTVNAATLAMLSKYCSEFLIHAADVEGLCRGIDEELVEKLGRWVVEAEAERREDGKGEEGKGSEYSGRRIEITYAGGAKSIEDLEKVRRLSNGRVDLTFGSALDIFGGTLVKLEECIRWNKEHARA